MISLTLVLCSVSAQAAHRAVSIVTKAGSAAAHAAGAATKAAAGTAAHTAGAAAHTPQHRSTQSELAFQGASGAEQFRAGMNPTKLAQQDMRREVRKVSEALDKLHKK